MRKYNSTLVRLDTWDLNYLLRLLSEQDSHDETFGLVYVLSGALDKALDENSIDLEEHVAELEETIFHLKGTIRRQNVSSSE